jgi:hypothetical protein
MALHVKEADIDDRFADLHAQLKRNTYGIRNIQLIGEDLMQMVQKLPKLKVPGGRMPKSSDTSYFFAWLVTIFGGVTRDNVTPLSDFADFRPRILRISDRFQAFFPDKPHRELLGP